MNDLQDQIKSSQPKIPAYQEFYRPLLADFDQQWVESVDMPTLIISHHQLLPVMQQLHQHELLQFAMLTDLLVVDLLAYGWKEWETAHATSHGFGRGRESYLDSFFEEKEAEEKQLESRFFIVYHLLSLVHQKRLRIKVAVDSINPMLSSVTSIWPNANWYEREAFDLFGIYFVDHPDLRRILTDYGFIGYPFRKDFPLTGHVEVAYDPEQMRVVQQPCSVSFKPTVPKVIREHSQVDFWPALVNEIEGDHHE